jgi:hypothetical protein
MTLQKLLWVAIGACVIAATASADPIRTVFTKENKFPGAMGWELSLAGGGSSFDADNAAEDSDAFFITPGVRFGATDRLAVRADIPYVGYSVGDFDEKGLGDISLGLEFLFFEDIFEYAWIVPHATAILATGDEDKGLGHGKGQGWFGISIGTTVNDVLHFGADASYGVNGSRSSDWNQQTYDDVFVGAFSLVWDLDQRSSLLGEIQFRDDPIDPDDSVAVRGHLGLIFRATERLSLMAYGGSSSGLREDFYGMGRAVFTF